MSSRMHSSVVIARITKLSRNSLRRDTTLMTSANFHGQLYSLSRISATIVIWFSSKISWIWLPLSQLSSSCNISARIREFSTNIAMNCLYHLVIIPFGSQVSQIIQKMPSSMKKLDRKSLSRLENTTEKTKRILKIYHNSKLSMSQSAIILIESTLWWLKELKP